MQTDPSHSPSLQVEAGSVAGLWRYPLKSMMGEELNAAEVTDRGLVGRTEPPDWALQARRSYRVLRLHRSETIRSRIATSRTRNSLLRARWARVPAAIRRAFARASSILRLIGDSLKPPIPPRLNEPEGPRSQSVVLTSTIAEL